MTVPQITLTPQGPTFSRLALGFWRLVDWGLTREQLLTRVQAVLDLGITTFDHADIYGDYQCEALFGAALAQAPGLRAQMQLVTKCGIKLVSSRRPAHNLKHYDTTRAHIVASVERSLTHLHTDTIDLLLIHRPDPLMDADEVAAAFTALRAAGKVQHFGVSNFTPAQYKLLASRLDFPLVTNQVEFSLMHLAPLHDGTFDLCQQRRIAPMAWSPLTGGRLFREEGARAARLRHAMNMVGDALGGATLDQVALAWILTHPAGVIPVLGSGKLERLQRAAAAADLRLSREAWFALWSASTGHEVP
jgi:predicted oxidoreductase